MRLPLLTAVLLASALPVAQGADDYKPGPDSLPQLGVAKGMMVKDTFTSHTIFPGTEREVSIYLPAGLDRSKPSPFMVFQDGVIYQAPIVLDNLIARKEIPPLIGIFIKPGVVPAAHEQALPRFNRSHEYDSVTDDYVRFLLEELLPTLETKHQLNLSKDPNARAIAGSSSGGICAFVAAWHRPDAFRRVFTNVGTYVGIHNADQLPVLVRKVEPKPLRLFLQSGTGDNNLYCGDWWMANQMMERSFIWAGYEVNHEWGEGGHNQKHATTIFPVALKWLWKGYPEEPVKVNPRGDSKWKGYEVVKADVPWTEVPLPEGFDKAQTMTANAAGEIFFTGRDLQVKNPQGDGVLSQQGLWKLSLDGKFSPFGGAWAEARSAQVGRDGKLRVAGWSRLASNEDQYQIACLNGLGEPVADEAVSIAKSHDARFPGHMVVTYSGWVIYTGWVGGDAGISVVSPQGEALHLSSRQIGGRPLRLALSPDQTLLYATGLDRDEMITAYQLRADGMLKFGQPYFQLQRDPASRMGDVDAEGLCVDAEGRLYVATRMGIQVCDQAGRVNFIIPTPAQPYDVCFAGKDLEEIYIACGDRVYRRPAKVRGVVSGQQAPIKPAAPKL